MTVAYISLALSIVLNSLSVILMKYYAVKLDTGPDLSFKDKIIDSRLIISIFAYAISACLWIVALSGVDLMVAYPTLALTYVIIGIISPYLFAEKMTINQWIGIVVIIAGVVIMNI